MNFPLLPVNPQQCRPCFDLHASPLQSAWHCQKAARVLASVRSNWLGARQHAECITFALQLTLSCKHAMLCTQLYTFAGVLNV